MKTIGYVVTMWLLAGAGGWGGGWGWGAVAQAGTDFTVQLDAAKLKASHQSKKADEAACVMTSRDNAGTLDSLQVKLRDKLDFDLSLSVGAGTVVDLKQGSLEVSLPPAAYADEQLVVTSRGSARCAMMLPAAKKDPKGSGSLVTVTLADSSFAKLDLAAREYLAGLRISDHELVRESDFGRTFQIYHLPSGVPAFPLPRHVNEKDDLELWMVLPKGAVAKVEVSSCDDVPALRVAGTYKIAAEAVGKLQSGESAELEQAPLSFRLEPYAKRLNCAGTLTYKIDVGYQGEQGTGSTSIAFERVVRFEWGIGYMFDFGRGRKYSLADRPTADGRSEKFLVASRDTTGAQPVIALGVNVCGTNPKALTWCDRLINPTLLVDPSRLTSGFGIGMVLRPFHGIGLLGGMTVFETTVLADGLMVKPGDPWTLAGAPTTKTVFNRDSLGFVLAVIVSTDVFAALSRSTP